MKRALDLWGTDENDPRLETADKAPPAVDPLHVGGEAPPDRITRENCRAVFGHLLGNPVGTFKHLDLMDQEQGMDAEDVQICRQAGQTLMERIDALQLRYARDLASIEGVPDFLRSLRDLAKSERWSEAGILYQEWERKMPKLGTC